MSVEYREYMKSDAWDRRRIAALKRADYHCQICGKENCVLDVHHNTYARLGREKLSDLIALCEDCHKLYHARLPKPPHDLLWFLNDEQKNVIRNMVIVQRKGRGQSG